MSLPYIPLYVDDYEAATAHLTIEEDGAYNRLLRLCWRTPGCSVPDDPKWIMRKMRVSADDYYRVVEPIIDEFFTRGMGRVFQARLQLEQQRAESTHQKKSDAGKKGNAKRWHSSKPLKTNKTSYRSAVAKQSQPEPEPEPYKKRETYVSIKENSWFEDWWKICPRKVGKGAAKTAFAKALKKADIETIFSAMTRYASERDGKEPQYTVHPATWLNQERWLDESQPTQRDFHNQIEEMLKHDSPRLPIPDQGHRGAAQQVPASIQAAGTPGHGGEAGAAASDSGGDQRAHLGLIQPRRFGGSR